MENVSLLQFGVRHDKKDLIWQWDIPENKDFDPERVKINNEMEIEAATLSYLPENTFLIVGNLLTFAEDVTPEMLMEKNIVGIISLIMS